MSRTYVIAVSRLLPERYHRATWIAHDRIRPCGAARLVLEQLGTKLHRALRRRRDIVDLHVRDPAADLPLLRHHGRERPRVAREHRHPSRPVGRLPPEQLLVERDGIGWLVATVVEPNELVGHCRLSFERGEVCRLLKGDARGGDAATAPQRKKSATHVLTNPSASRESSSRSTVAAPSTATHCFIGRPCPGSNASATPASRSSAARAALIFTTSLPLTSIAKICLPTFRPSEPNIRPVVTPGSRSSLARTVAKSRITTRPPPVSRATRKPRRASRGACAPSRVDRGASRSGQ